MSDNQSPTKVERGIRWFSNNPVISILIIFGIVVIALGNFTDSVDKISKFFGGSNNIQTQARKPLSFDPDTMKTIMQASHVNLESVKPTPREMKVVPNQMLPISGIVIYEYPNWVQGIEVSLKMNREPEDGRFWHSLAEKRVPDPIGRVSLSGLIPSVSAEDLNARQVKVQAEMVIFDNESGTRHVIATSRPILFEVAK